MKKLYKTTVNLFAVMMLLIISSVSYAQTVSEKGAKIKHIDYKIPAIKTKYGEITQKIRNTISSKGEVWVYSIGSMGSDGVFSSEFSIEELNGIISELESLKKEELKDIAINPDNLDNSYISPNGFIVAYSVYSGASQWRIVIDSSDYRSRKYIEDINLVLDALINGREKLKELSLK